MLTKIQLKKKVTVKENDCWAIGTYPGYNVLTVDGKCRSAHKVFYQAFVGRVPRGKLLTNKCRHRWCVNPEHWMPLTQKEAIRHGIISRGESDKRSLVGRWMDAEGMTTEELADIAGSKKSAARSWRQGGYPNAEAEANIRKKYPGFPIKPVCEGTI